MPVFRRQIGAVAAAAVFAGALGASSPASAQWWGWGGGCWGCGYNNAGAVAGAAVAGMAVGALAGAAIASQNQPQYAAQPYYAPVRRGRGCIAWQPIYDSWGNFLQYQQVRVACQ